MDFTLLSGLLAMLGDAASSPAMLLICALLVFVAGIACGALGRFAASPDAITDDEAGDTHAHMTLPPPTRRVRAGRPPLPYSYDGRKHAPAESAVDRH